MKKLFAFSLQRFGVILGRVGQLEVSTDGNAWTKVGRLVNADLSATRAEAEATNHDSGEFEEFEPERLSATLTAEFRRDEDDAGQTILATAHYSTTGTDGDTSDIKLYFRLTMKAGGQKQVGYGFLTDYSLGSPNTGLAPLNITARLNSVEVENAS